MKLKKHNIWHSRNCLSKLEIWDEWCDVPMKELPYCVVFSSLTFTAFYSCFIHMLHSNCLSNPIMPLWSQKLPLISTVTSYGRLHRRCKHNCFIAIFFIFLNDVPPLVRAILQSIWYSTRPEMYTFPRILLYLIPEISNAVQPADNVRFRKQSLFKFSNIFSAVGHTDFSN